MRKRRQKYSASDEMKIFQYIISEKVHSDVRGKAIWRNMQHVKVTNHSAESMRTHFLKHMVPKLNSYPIFDTWKKKLSYLVPVKTASRAFRRENESECDDSDSEESISGFDASPVETPEKIPRTQNGGAKTQDRINRLRRRGYRDKTSSNRNDVVMDTEFEDTPAPSVSAPSRTRQHGAPSWMRQHGALKRSAGARPSPEPLPKASSKRRPSQSARLQPQSASPRRARTRQQQFFGALHHHKEEEEEEASSPASFLTALDVPQPSCSRQPFRGANGTSAVTVPNSGRGTDISSVIETLCQEFHLSREQALQSLWVTTGSMEDAFHWLKHGRRRNGCPAWSSEEDDILRGADPDKIADLRQKFGEEDIRKRIVFLDF